MSNSMPLYQIAFNLIDSGLMSREEAEKALKNITNEGAGIVSEVVDNCFALVDTKRGTIKYNYSKIAHNMIHTMPLPLAREMYQRITSHNDDTVAAWNDACDKYVKQIIDELREQSSERVSLISTALNDYMHRTAWMHYDEE